MEEIIKRIFYDDRTQEELFREEEEDERAQIREEIRKTLSEEEKRLLIKLEDAWVKKTCDDMERCYIKGFKTGVRLISKSLK